MPVLSVDLSNSTLLALFCNYMKGPSIPVAVAIVLEQSFVMCGGLKFAAPVNERDILYFAAIMTKHTYWQASTGKLMNSQKRAHTVLRRNVDYMTLTATN